MPSEARQPPGVAAIRHFHPCRFDRKLTSSYTTCISQLVACIYRISSDIHLSLSYICLEAIHGWHYANHDHYAAWPDTAGVWYTPAEYKAAGWKLTI